LSDRTDDPAPSPALTTGVILCGGAGQRAGGADKPLLTLGGRPIVLHVLARVAPQVAHVVISANRNIARYGAFGRVVADSEYAQCGPLAGVLAAARITPTPWLLVCPGDAPTLPTDLLQRLAASVTAASGANSALETLMTAPAPVADAALPLTADGRQPLPLLVRTRCALGLDVFLGAGKRRVGEWLTTLHAVTADFRGRETEFANLNHLESFDPGQAPT